MTGFLSSARRRRRLGKGGAFVFVTAGIAFSMIHWANTAHLEETPLRDEPADVAPDPVPAPFAKAKREGVLRIATRFVNTAVVRHDVDDSWELTAPALRTGYTRRTWAQGNIPVQPYPVEGAKWKVDYSWRDVVGLKVALFPKKGEDVPAAVFDMQLHAYGTGDKRRWLVDSWTPTSYQGIPSGPLGGSRSSAPDVPEVKQILPTSWLLVPLGVLALSLLVPIFIGLRGWMRGKKALRAYRSSLQ